ncbi:rCG56987 [Rattus norvegicus]|uniref:RCG56987 n=1 Tax=Rattus norvegicus TaxID=10116 RepID=A6JDA3_RAT|nr:rCG56987 [Rattus norvegicus]
MPDSKYLSSTIWVPKNYSSDCKGNTPVLAKNIGGKYRKSQLTQDPKISYKSGLAWPLNA